MTRKNLFMMIALFLVVGLALVLSVDTAMAQKPGPEICDNGIDDDLDGFIDEKDSDCQKKTTGCSPGFYKNHPEVWVNICCTTTSDPTCGELNTALTCRGSDESCGRSAAAAFLDECTGCSE